jgi:hypothetical protein
VNTTDPQPEPDLTDTQKAYNVAQSEMFQLAAYGHCTYTNGELLTAEGKRQQADYNDRIRRAREELEAAVLRLVAEHAETFANSRFVSADWLRSLADDPAILSLLAVRPDEREAVSSVGSVPATDRAALSAKLWAIAEHHIVAEWICCEPLKPGHKLCAKGYAALGMVKTLLVDGDPEKAWNPSAPLLDAVLSVLPASVDRAAVLEEAADFFRGLHVTGTAISAAEAEAELRRMADETPRAEAQPRRGDQFEAWLKAQRAEFERGESPWPILDYLLDRYRLHADTGTPLGEHVCEGRTVGDCECLESAPPVHVGGNVNAEDCPACTGSNPPYPFICPGPNAVVAQPAKEA